MNIDRVPVCLAAIAVATELSCAGPAPPLTGTDLLGTWSASIEHAGQTGELVLRFERGEEDGRLRASLSLPTIDAWNVASLPVVIEGERIDLGLFTLVRRDDRLLGELPAALVPVYRLPFTLQRSDEVEAPRRPPEPVSAPLGEPLWVRDLGSPIWAGVTVSSGVLFVGTDGGTLFALDAATGDIRWRVEAGGAIRGRPVVAEGRLFVPSDDGLLLALNPTDGGALWTARLQSQEVERVAPGHGESRYDHYASSASCSGDTVFAASHEGALVALDARSGAERWRFATGDIVTSTPAVAEGRVIFGSFDGHVYALDAESGRELWRLDTGAPVPSSPVVEGGLALVGSRSYELFALDAESGRPRWRHYVWYSWIESSATVSGGEAFVGSSDAQLLFALDLESGEERWQFDTGGSIWSQPAVSDETVVAGAVGVAGYMVEHRGGLLAVDRDSGRARWSFPVDRLEGGALWGFAASPAIEGERLFAAALDGRVYAFPLGGRR